jgi:tetratricopeptide (TPR) repeat protein
MVLPASDAGDLAIARARIDESTAARRVRDYASARAKAAEAVQLLLTGSAAEQGAGSIALLDAAAFAAANAQDAPTAEIAWSRVVEVRLSVLPEGHPNLQAARGNLAMTIRLLGDLPRARELLEKVLEVYSRQPPTSQLDMARARQALAATLHALGDLQGARSLQEQMLEALSRTLPDDHPDLQSARGNLALTIKTVGDLQGARALEEKVLEVARVLCPTVTPTS